MAIVTHNMQQATRIADYTAFFLVGRGEWNTRLPMSCLRFPRIREPRIILPDASAVDGAKIEGRHEHSSHI